MRTAFRVATAALVLGASFSTKAQAAEIGHYGPGVTNIRDFAMPGPGFYGVLYNYLYSTDRLNDADGEEVSSITFNPGPGSGVTIDVDVDVDMYALSPVLIWVSNWKVLGASYGAYAAPMLANSNIAAALTATTGSARDAETSEFDLGDLFVQPVWLGWGLPNWDFTVAYGFYAPVGRYETETVTLPVVGDLTAESAKNIGLGFWTHQFQGAVNWYPWPHRGTAVVGALTYEVHGEKEDFDLTPGQNVTINWGISQFLPLKKDQSLLLELGPRGYSVWQVSDDEGTNAKNPSVHDEVHAIGGQVGLTYVPWVAALNIPFQFEVSSSDRFQGNSLGINLAKQF